MCGPGPGRSPRQRIDVRRTSYATCRMRADDAVTPTTHDGPDDLDRRSIDGDERRVPTRYADGATPVPARPDRPQGRADRARAERGRLVRGGGARRVLRGRRGDEQRCDVVAR